MDLCAGKRIGNAGSRIRADSNPSGRACRFVIINLTRTEAGFRRAAVYPYAAANAADVIVHLTVGHIQRTGALDRGGTDIIVHLYVVRGHVDGAPSGVNGSFRILVKPAAAQVRGAACVIQSVFAGVEPAAAHGKAAVLIHACRRMVDLTAAYRCIPVIKINTVIRISDDTAAHVQCAAAGDQIDPVTS